MIRANVRFTGNVQGVGFRATTRDIATSYKVVGWVRNEADGSVTLAAEGEADEVARFLDEIHDRMHGRIERADRHDQRPIGEEGFEILY